MERKAFAVWLIVTGLLVGLLGNMLFYGKLVGLSFPLFAAVSIGVLLASSRPAGRRLNVRNLWPFVPLLLFALMVAVRADELILALDVLAALALGGLALHYLTLDRHIDQEPLTGYAGGLTQAGFYPLLGALPELYDSWAWLREKGWHDRGPFVAIGRGLLIALPVVVIFAALLASADLVFADYLDRVWQLIAIQNPEDLMGRAMVTAMLGWLATGALAYGVARRFGPPPRESAAGNEAVVDDAVPNAADASPPKRAAVPFKLGMIESGIILGSVDLLFGAFVLIQFAYFFGGAENIAAGKFTFAQYARRGFFELVAVSILTLGLILFLDWVTVREGRRQNRVFRALSVVIVALTAVMLASASQRMWLYEEAYGFTHLRVYTHVFMLWLGVLLGVFLLALFRLRKNIFSLGMLLVMVAYLGTLNLMDVDAYIAERNIARYREGRELDVRFLRTLSADAVPAMLDLYQSAHADPQVHEGVGLWLARHLSALDSLRAGAASTIFSFNASRERAWLLLNDRRAALPEYDAYQDYLWDYNYAPPGDEYGYPASR